MRLLVTAALLLTLPGCSLLLPDAKFMEALSKDPATACVTISSVYGVVKIYRTAAPTASVACTQDGMTVR